MTDTTLITVIVLFLLLAYGLRLLLARKTGQALTAFDLVQGLVLPIALILAEVLYQKTGTDCLLTVLTVGIIEELYFSHKRKKRQKNAKD